MNDRIRELLAQAGYTPLPGFDFANSLEEVFLQKFAELIVQECCSKLEEMGEGWQEFAKNPPQGQTHNASEALFAAYRLKEDAVWKLKEHFGVNDEIL